MKGTRWVGCGGRGYGVGLSHTGYTVGTVDVLHLEVVVVTTRGSGSIGAGIHGDGSAALREARNEVPFRRRALGVGIAVLRHLLMSQLA